MEIHAQINLFPNHLQTQIKKCFMCLKGMQNIELGRKFLLDSKLKAKKYWVVNSTTF